MTYRIRGLEPGLFEHYFAMGEEELVAHRARLVIATSSRGYPCRASLEDAREGERLVLVHHVHHAVDTPYRSAFAVYVREGIAEPAEFVDACPPVFAGRPLSLRCFDAGGALAAARLVTDGDADAAIRELFADPAIAYIDAHNAAHGCFAARIERHGDPA